MRSSLFPLSTTQIFSLHFRVDNEENKIYDPRFCEFYYRYRTYTINNVTGKATVTHSILLPTTNCLTKHIREDIWEKKKLYDYQCEITFRLEGRGLNLKFHT